MIKPSERDNALARDIIENMEKIKKLRGEGLKFKTDYEILAELIAAYVAREVALALKMVQERRGKSVYIKEVCKIIPAPKEGE